MIKDAGRPLARALENREPSHSELTRIRCLDETETTVLVSASPLLGLDGAPVGAVVLIQDVTERRTIERELEERVTRLISLGVELEQSTGVDRDQKPTPTARP
jgi:PAS domain-containing protein